MAHDVFISYSSEDKEVADAICCELEKNSIKCWYAPRDIQPGDEWASSIVSAINQAKIMVLIFTDCANSSKQVLREVGYAADAGIVIIPFKLTAKNPDGGFMYYLKSIHWLDALNSQLSVSIENLYLLCDKTLNTNIEQKPQIVSSSEKTQINTINPYKFNEGNISKSKNRNNTTAKNIVMIIVAFICSIISVIFFVATFVPDEFGNNDLSVSIVCIVIGLVFLLIAFFSVRKVIKNQNLI